MSRPRPVKALLRRLVGHCLISHRCASAFQTQSVNKRYRSGSDLSRDVEAQAFAIVLARPVTVPRLTALIVRIEVLTAES